MAPRCIYCCQLNRTHSALGSAGIYILCGALREHGLARALSWLDCCDLIDETWLCTNALSSKSGLTVAGSWKDQAECQAICCSFHHSTDSLPPLSLSSAGQDADYVLFSILYFSLVRRFHGQYGRGGFSHRQKHLEYWQRTTFLWFHILKYNYWALHPNPGFTYTMDEFWDCKVQNLQC